MDELNDGGAGKGDSFDDEGRLVGGLVGYQSSIFNFSFFKLEKKKDKMEGQ